ncbi:helix-turn-helix domain-containing protein [Luedemannella helvata]|uniref:Helix-turn-helix transcriptional regulator n=1 Tax=Luedemannella helvata TaxID=349315 RepID=A0ABP4X5M4_9ACTN
MDDLPIGRRVAYWRSRRRISQQVFADRLGKSKSWVDKVERGVRRLDKYSVIYEIADVLQIDMQLLTGRDPARRPEDVNCVDQVEVEEIRAALERYDQISAFFDTPVEPAPLPEVTKSVVHAWSTLQHAKYGVLARSLPKLLRDCQALASMHTGENGQQAAVLLSQVYQVASSTLRKLGEHDLAWLAADRGLASAQRSGEALLVGVATTRVALSLIALGRFRAALEINVNLANRLAPAGDQANDPRHLSVYGQLLLQGTMAAARMGDSATSRDLLTAATDAAAKMGGDANHYWTCFGPTNVELHRAAAAVEMGDGGRAVETHEALNPDNFAAMLPERRAHHLLDTARAFTQVGDVAKASELLIEADRLAPSEIRCRPLAHEVISDVLRRTRGTPPAAITELAGLLSVRA